MSVLSLGYVRLRSPKLAEWNRYATEVLGLMAVTGPDAASQYYRIDKYPYRVQILPGDEPAIEAIGFEVGDDRSLASVVRAVEDAGVKVEMASNDAAALLVSGLARFTDPGGTPIELFYGPVFDHSPVVTPLVSGFVTGEMGMGHVVLKTDDITASSDFYRDVLGFHRRNTWYRGNMTMEFFGCNPRHHTLALGAGLPMPGKLLHFMVEAATIDDVGYAQDRCVDHGVPVVSALGKHTNDHMISFYSATPDGYTVEFGWGGLQIDEVETTATYQITKPSFWGHRPLKT